MGLNNVSQFRAIQRQIWIFDLSEGVEFDPQTKLYSH